MIEQEFFIGSVKKNYRTAATVEPLFRLSLETGDWEPLLDSSELGRLFPNNGCVSWVRVTQQVSEGSLWQFKVVLQPTYNAESAWHDRYMVDISTALPLIEASEVLDVEKLGGEQLGRERLCTRGVCLHVEGAVNRWVRAENRLWSSLPFVPKEGEPALHIIDPSILDKPIRFYTDSNPISTLDLPLRGEVRTFFLLSNVMFEGTLVLRDWSPDAVVLKRVMGKLRKWDRGFAENLGLADKTLERVEAILGAPPVSINDLDMERARFQRARVYLSKLVDAEALHTAALVVLEEGPIATEIENEKVKILQRETAKARERANEAILAEKEGLERVREQITELTQTRDGLFAEIEAIRRRQSSFLDKLDESLESRLAQLLKKPEQVLADVAILKAVEKSLGTTTSTKRTESVQKIASSIDAVENRSTFASCTDLVTFSKNFQKALLANDTPPNAWRAIFSSLLGGGVPLLVGSRARRAFEAFAGVATRGEVHWIQVQPTWMCVRDAIAGGLSELLLSLGESDHLQLVVLEGVNTAPVESYLCPLLADYAVAWDGRVSAPQLTNGEWKANTAELSVHAWPKNVLLGGMLVDGFTSLGLPASSFCDCTLILMDEIRAGAELDLFSKMHPSLRGKNGVAPNISEIPLDSWISWRENATAMNLDTAIEMWDRLAANHDLSRLGRDRFLATFAASRLATTCDELAVSDSIAYTALPLLAAAARDQRQDFANLSFEYRDLAQVTELIGQLLRK